MMGGGFRNRRTLTSEPEGGSDANAVVGKVKEVRRGHSSAERKVKVETDNGKMDLLVESRHAKKLDKEKSYKFHLEEPTYMGGGSSRLSNVQMTTRAEGAPRAVSESKFESRFAR